MNFYIQFLRLCSLTDSVKVIQLWGEAWISRVCLVIQFLLTGSWSFRPRLLSFIFYTQLQFAVFCEHKQTETKCLTEKLNSTSTCCLHPEQVWSFDELVNSFIKKLRISEGKQQFKEGCCDISQINTVDRLTEKIISRWTWNKIILTTSSWSRFSLWTQTENNVLRINVRSQWIWPLTFHVQYLTSSWGASGLCENQVKGRASFCVRPPPRPARLPAGDRLKCQTEQDWSETRLQAANLFTLLLLCLIFIRSSLTLRSSRSCPLQLIHVTSQENTKNLVSNKKSNYSFDNKTFRSRL